MLFCFFERIRQFNLNYNIMILPLIYSGIFLSAINEANSEVLFQNIPVSFEESFEQYENPNDFKDPIGPWSGWGYWQLAADPADPANSVMTHTSHTSSTPRLYAGDETLGDQAMSFKFKWDGDYSQYYLWSMAIRRTSAGLYKLYATNETNDGRVYIYLVRDGHAPYLDATYGAGNWVSYKANQMNDAYLSGEATTDIIGGVELENLTQNEWHEITIRAKGDYIHVYYDGEPLYKTVRDHFDINPQGEIGIGIAQGIMLDDIVVTDWSNASAIDNFTTSAGNGTDIHIVAGQSIQLDWTTIAAAAVELKENGTTVATDVSGSYVATPSSDSIYELVTMGSAGGETQIINVTLEDGAKFQTVSLTEATIASGTSTTIEWEATDADYVTIDGIAGQFPTTGSLEVYPTETTTYAIRAVGQANTDSKWRTVEVGNIVSTDFNPLILPTLSELAGGLPLSLNTVYKLDIGGYAATSANVSWSTSPAGVLAIDANGNVTVLDSNFSSEVAITANINGENFTRYIYPNEGANLFTNSDFSTTAAWGKTVWAGPCQIDRTDLISHSPDWSMRASCAGDGRTGVYQGIELTPGVYQLDALIRGLNIAEEGLWDSNIDLLVLNDDTAQTISADMLTYGSFGWTEVQKVINITEAGKYYFYIRLFSRGTLWVDEMKLTQVNSNEPEAVRVGDMIGAMPSPCEEDLPACPVSAPTPELALSDFQNQTEGSYIISSNLQYAFADRRENGTYELKTVLEHAESGFISAWDHTGLPSNWTGYDYLEFSVFNATNEFVDFIIEIQDAQSVDYWSRVNWYDKLAPGENKFRVPLQIFVGERIQIKTPRRLFLEEVTWLALAFYNKGTFYISDIKLTEEPMKCSRPENVKAFDFGSEQSPIQFGYTPVFGNTQYASCRGFGIAGDSIWRVEDRRSPDNLYRDWISFYDDSSTDFKVDLENGDYKVKVLWEDAGYWEWYPNYISRSVNAEGVNRCDGNASYEDFQDRYFAHEYAEDKPNTDTWEKYIASRFNPSCEFDVTVADGQLDIGFKGSNPFAASINGLVIYPADDATQAETWLADIDGVRKTAFEYDYRRLDIAKATGDDLINFTSQGEQYMLFQRGIDQDIYLNTAPSQSEIITDLNYTALQNERVAAQFAIFPLVDLGSVDDITVNGLPAGITVSPQQVFHMDMRLVPDGIVYGAKPLVLDSNINAALTPNQSRQFIVNLAIGENIEPGTYSATVNLQQGTTTVASVPLTLTVEPFVLPESPIRHSVLGTFPLYTGGAFETQLEVKRWAEIPSVLSTLDTYGMTALTGMYPAEIINGECDTTKAETFIAELNQYNFDSLIHTYMAPEEGQHGKLQSSYYANNTAKAQQVIECTNALYQQHGYQIAWSLFDEPGSVSVIDDSINMFDWYANLATTTGFISSGFTSVHDTHTELGAAREQLFLATDYPFITLLDEPSLIAKRDAGKPWGMYNMMNRYGYGLFGWMLRQNYAVTDISAFALHSMQSDHYYVLDSRETDAGFIFTDRNGVVRPTIRLERLSQGITDYRYLTALENAIAVDPTTNAAVDAQNYLDALLTQHSLSNRFDLPESNVFSAVRANVIAHLNVMSGPIEPTIALNSSSTTLTEGSETTISISASDVVNTVLTIDWADGIVDTQDLTTDGTGNYTHTYAQQGSYAVVVSACNDDACVEETVTLNVVDTTPVVTAIVPTTTTEGSMEVVNCIVDSYDAVAAESWTVNGVEFATTPQASYIFASNGTTEICANVVDADNSAASACVTVIVEDTAPTAQFTFNNNIAEGQAATFTSTSMQNIDTIESLNWDFGDSTTASGTNVEHIYTADGTYHVCLTATDSDGSAHTACNDITITDTAPVASFTVSSTEIHEGDVVTFESTTVAGVDDIVALEFDFADGNMSTQPSSQHIFANSGDYNVCLTATDSDGSSSTSCKNITVTNVAPVFTADLTGPLEPQQLGSTAQVTADFIDQGADDLTVTYDWGDESTSSFTLPAGSTSYAADHTYVSAGVFSVKVTITDENGASISQQYEYVVVFDPTAGSISGNGQFENPHGAFLLDANYVDGTAIGFTAKYKNNGQLIGNLKLKLKKADVKFKSTSLDWLVVNGAESWLQGWAELNETGQYQFQLHFIDAELDNTISEDVFRVRIWNPVTDELVYDSSRNETDSEAMINTLIKGDLKVKP